jgi:thiamine-phosphate pyrophosphorylase
MEPCPDLPRHYVISPPTPSTASGREQLFHHFLQAMEKVCRRKDSMVLLRHVPGMAEGDERLLRACLAVAKHYQTICLLHGDGSKAHTLDFSGVHWRASQLLNANRAQAPGLMQAASCHSARELQLAAKSKVDFVVLGPVCPTASHPDQRPLGWSSFGELANQASMPVFALGGMRPEDLAEAQRWGAHGVAGIRSFWPSG